MKTKTVKEKVIEIIESMYRTQAPYSEWADEIDRVYRKEIDKHKEALIWCSGSQDFQVEGKARIGWNKICRPLLKSETSFTCCNIEVNEKKGSEVMCPECKEWVTTK